MKKIVFLVLVLCLALIMTGCSKANSTSNDTTNAQITTASPDVSGDEDVKRIKEQFTKSFISITAEGLVASIKEEIETLYKSNNTANTITIGINGTYKDYYLLNITQDDNVFTDGTLGSFDINEFYSESIEEDNEYTLPNEFDLSLSGELVIKYDSATNKYTYSTAADFGILGYKVAIDKYGYCDVKNILSTDGVIPSSIKENIDYITNCSIDAYGKSIVDMLELKVDNLVDEEDPDVNILVGINSTQDAYWLTDVSGSENVFESTNIIEDAIGESYIGGELIIKYDVASKTYTYTANNFSHYGLYYDVTSQGACTLNKIVKLDKAFNYYEESMETMRGLIVALSLYIVDFSIKSTLISNYSSELEYCILGFKDSKNYYVYVDDEACTNIFESPKSTLEDTFLAMGYVIEGQLLVRYDGTSFTYEASSDFAINGYYCEVVENELTLKGKVNN